LGHFMPLGQHLKVVQPPYAGLYILADLCCLAQAFFFAPRHPCFSGYRSDPTLRQTLSAAPVPSSYILLVAPARAHAGLLVIFSYILLSAPSARLDRLRLLLRGRVMCFPFSATLSAFTRHAARANCGLVRGEWWRNRVSGAAAPFRHRTLAPAVDLRTPGSSG
jgi:hypothetical protein